MIVTSSSITWKYLNQARRYLNGIRVTIEERRNNKRIIKCHRCQVWGHATSNCFRPHRYLKSAGSHATHTCPKPRTEPAKCANCGKDHPANVTICRMYQNKLAQRDGRTSSRTPTRVRYEDVPIPTTNAWQNQRPANTNSNNNNGRDNRTSQQSSSTDLADRHQYPELNRKQPIAQPTTHTQQGPRQDNPISTAQETMAEIRKLVNLDEVDRALTDLLKALQKATSQKSRFDIYYAFI